MVHNLFSFMAGLTSRVQRVATGPIHGAAGGPANQPSLQRPGGNRCGAAPNRPGLPPREASTRVRAPRYHPVPRPSGRRLHCWVWAAALWALGVSAAEPTWKYSARQFRPFWESSPMEGESVLFVKADDTEPPRASLLFEPTRILRVGSSSGETTYEEGRDYVWKAGQRRIELTRASRIPFKTPAELRRPAKSQAYSLPHRDGQGDIFFGGGHEYHDLQTVITYEHRGGWAGPKPKFGEESLPRALAKLRERAPLKIALFGDSISTGCNASGWAKTPPFQPPWQELLAEHLRTVYGGPVALTNFAVGGTDTAWGVANIARVAEERADLVLLAFGMNDVGGRSTPSYRTNIQAMMEAILKVQPETEFILVATMLGNRDWTTLHHELFLPYRDALASLCRPGVALADLTSVWDEMLKFKRDWDLTGNGVNHPNDFGHRVYAQVLVCLLVPPDRRP